MSSYHDAAKLPVGTEIATARLLRVVSQGFGGTTFVDIESHEDFFTNINADPGSWNFIVAKSAPKKFKVGDAVSGNDYAALPVGAVVLDLRPEPDAYRKFAPDGWRSTDDDDDFVYQNTDLCDDRTIVYLPES